MEMTSSCTSLQVENTQFSAADEQMEYNDTHSFGNKNVKVRKHSIILDFSTVSFVDTVTLKTLKNVSALGDQKQRGMCCDQ